jgi:hypothetical protein
MKSKVAPSIGSRVFSGVKWLDAMREIVGPENVKTSYLDRAYYCRNHSTDFVDLDHGYAPDVVVLPATEDEVSRIVGVAAKEKIAITPRGLEQASGVVQWPSIVA